MEDMVNERLILLATAQECMMDSTDIIEKWESSLTVLEKSTFDSINSSDIVLNLSKEGKRLAVKLQEYYRELIAETDSNEAKKLAVLLMEMNQLFYKINEAATTVNETSHNIEREVACQRDYNEVMKSSIVQVIESVDSAVACAEFVLAEL